MKIPFTLDAWLKDKSQKVVNKDGRPVRIICTDADGLYPIIGLLDNKIPFPYGKDGRLPYIEGGGGTLFLVTPDPELSEFELTLLDWLSSDTCGEIPMEKMKECVKARASKLLILGKAEALKDLPRWKKLILKQSESFVGCRNEYELFHKGRVIALSELEKLPSFNED